MGRGERVWSAGKGFGLPEKQGDMPGRAAAALCAQRDCDVRVGWSGAAWWYICSQQQWGEQSAAAWGGPCAAAHAVHRGQRIQELRHVASRNRGEGEGQRHQEADGCRGPALQLSSTSLAARKTTTQKAPRMASLEAPARILLAMVSISICAPATVPITPTSRMPACQRETGKGGIERW